MNGAPSHCIAVPSPTLQEVPREQDSEVKALARRGQMLQKLLAVLDSAAALGKGPALSEFLKDTNDVHQLEPGMARYSLSPSISTNIKD